MEFGDAFAGLLQGRGTPPSSGSGRRRGIQSRRQQPRSQRSLRLTQTQQLMDDDDIVEEDDSPMGMVEHANTTSAYAAHTHATMAPEGHPMDEDVDEDVDGLTQSPPPAQRHCVSQRLPESLDTEDADSDLASHSQQQTHARVMISQFEAGRHATSEFDDDNDGDDNDVDDDDFMCTAAAEAAEAAEAQMRLGGFRDRGEVLDDDDDDDDDDDGDAAVAGYTATNTAKVTCKPEQQQHPRCSNCSNCSNGSNGSQCGESGSKQCHHHVSI
ncbi:hypothetical protein PTSG_07594 [Salpingoeca rosetta]|uniref:Uncharacterized protein n=1 Tax=Salpingoeca rosetta (strain ATCC 50818 / BSB-021) TaxID=946362 RepID=F2UH79_SALR5|nr:uncharacterized protein PTSG_07594 [Salpingoeca rosetta]EGD76478.1 hypothetical protein PTSG_07594 [Salpingoeca rosetta]|eukprot:XP_004991392.1 hypothetical protein PTSG_07594 [Salpingoeca rosetta]